MSEKWYCFGFTVILCFIRFSADILSGLPAGLIFLHFVQPEQSPKPSAFFTLLGVALPVPCSSKISRCLLCHVELRKSSEAILLLLC